MNQRKLSKLLSLTLRHKPETLGVTLDENGWADVKNLLGAMQGRGYGVDFSQLENMVINNDKQRFSFNADKSKIRANQGHSLKINLQLTPLKPPDFLYHGTVAKFLESIKLNGLQKRSRHHVHLSPDIATATKVGSRRGKPTILRIKSTEMHKDGYKFYCSENGVWLTDKVPAQYIDFSNLHFPTSQLL